MIPGSNLYRSAVRLIKQTTVQYMKFNNRTLNAARQFVSGYDTAFDLQCSLQAVQRSSYQNLGLDFQKNYVKVYAAQDMIDLKRDSSGDRFIYAGLLYQLEDQKTWYLVDGWVSCLAVEVGVAP